MAGIIDFIDNQPIRFQATPDDVSCIQDFNYSTIIDAADQVQYQMKLQLCDDALPINRYSEFIDGATADANLTNTSGTRYYWDYSVSANVIRLSFLDSLFDGGWGFDDGGTAGVGFGSVTLTSDKNIVQSGYYKIRLYVTSKTNLTYDSSYDFTISGSTTGTLVQDFLKDLDEGWNEWYVWFTAVEKVTFTFWMFTAGQGQAIGFRDLEIYHIPFEEIRMGIVNSSGTVVNLYRVGDQINSTTQDGTNWKLYDEYLTWTRNFSESELSDGCYTLCIYDPCINTNNQLGVANGFMDMNQGVWTYTDSTVTDGNPDVEAADNIASITSNTELTGTYLQIGSEADWAVYVESTSILAAGYTYNIDIDFGTIVDTVASPQIRVSAGGAATTVNINGLSNSTWGFTVAGGGGVLKIETALGNDFNNYVQIKNLRCYLSSTSLTSNYCSDTFKIGDTSCTVVLRGCNDEDSFGFDFTRSGFSLQSRIEGVIVNPKYPTQRETYENSDGRLRNIYFERKKYKELRLAFQPEYILDFISLLEGIDHFYIDGIEYVVAMDEEVEYITSEDLPNFERVIMPVRRKEVLVRNIQTTVEGVGCAVEVECLLDPSDLTCVIDPQSGEVVVSLE